MMRHRLAGWIVLALTAAAGAGDTPWKRHTIDDASRGADGVRLADVNGDDLADIVTGWEEGGQIRVYLHPAGGGERQKWPAVTVGAVRSPEDAVFVDLDGDGSTDVVSACEGREKTVYVHWAPPRERYLDAAAWTMRPIAAAQGRQMWMFTLPMQIDGLHGVDLVVGSKGQGGSIGWLEAPADARDTAAWKYHRLYDAGWIMSLESLDIDGDGDMDILASDRKGKTPGVLWLENPGPIESARGRRWTEHRIGADGVEVLFLTTGDIDADGLSDIACSTRAGVTYIFRRATRRPVSWQSYTIQNPWGIINGKAVAIGDINGDGKMDLVQSTGIYADKADKGKPGVFWMRGTGDPGGRWESTAITREGTKFDLVQLLDVDGDGDLDVVTCEERANLGVFWFENPAK